MSCAHTAAVGGGAASKYFNLISITTFLSVSKVICGGHGHMVTSSEEGCQQAGEDPACSNKNGFNSESHVLRGETVKNRSDVPGAKEIERRFDCNV